MIKKIARRITPPPIWHQLQLAKQRILFRTTPAVTAPKNDSESILSCLVAYNEFGGYCVPKSSVHRPAAQKILAGDVWERDTIEYVTSHCGGGDIVHAGTYFGDFLPALSGACTNGSKVWAFEPNPENYRCASITVLLNNLPNIDLTNAGLGSKEGVVTMVTKDTSGKSLGGQSRIDTTGRSAGTTETIRIVSVDDVVPEERNVSLIHLDVEGYEKEALSGGLKTIARCLPILILETLPEEPWFSDSILGLGYEITGRTEGNSILVCTSKG